MIAIIRTKRGEISAEEISVMVSREAGYFVSRNAVIGKWRREGLEPIKAKLQHVHKPRKHNAERFVVRKPQLNRNRMRLPRSRPHPVWQEPVNGGIPFVQLASMHCREVLDDRGADGLALCCGRQRQERSSYCPWHHRKNHNEQAE
jgi:hypothetical protein